MTHNRVYALYRDFETAATVTNKLISGGFDSKHISVITNDTDNKYSSYINTSGTDVVKEDLSGEEGAGIGALMGALTGLSMALVPGFGPVLVAGPLAVALMAGIGAATGAATGGLTASLVDFGVSDAHASHYQDVLRTGGALVIVDLVNESDESTVRGILKQHDPLNIEYENGPIR